MRDDDRWPGHPRLLPDESISSWFNGDLRHLRVGVVGCGGTGSAVAMLLARLGVGQIALFDEDVVERTNLNRLHGARQSDADAMRPKVQAVAASIVLGDQRG